MYIYGQRRKKKKERYVYERMYVMQYNARVKGRRSKKRELQWNLETQRALRRRRGVFHARAKDQKRARRSLRHGPAEPDDPLPTEWLYATLFLARACVCFDKAPAYNRARAIVFFRDVAAGFSGFYGRPALFGNGVYLLPCI